MSSPLEEELAEGLEATKEHHKLINFFSARMSKQDELAVRRYVRWSFPMNYYLNTGKLIYSSYRSSTVSSISTLYEKAKQRFKTELLPSIKYLDNIIQKLPNKRPQLPHVLWRASRDGLKYASQDGDIYTFPSFLSTSLRKDISLIFMGSNKCCLFKMNIRAQVPYLYMSHKSWAKNEMDFHPMYEIMLCRGVQLKQTNQSTMTINTYGSALEIDVLEFDLIGHAPVTPITKLAPPTEILIGVGNPF